MLPVTARCWSGSLPPPVSCSRFLDSLLYIAATDLRRSNGLPPIALPELRRARQRLASRLDRRGLPETCRRRPTRLPCGAHAPRKSASAMPAGSRSSTRRRREPARSAGSDTRHGCGSRVRTARMAARTSTASSTSLPPPPPPTPSSAGPPRLRPSQALPAACSHVARSVPVPRCHRRRHRHRCRQALASLRRHHPSRRRRRRRRHRRRHRHRHRRPRATGCPQAGTNPGVDPSSAPRRHRLSGIDRQSRPRRQVRHHHRARRRHRPRRPRLHLRRPCRRRAIRRHARRQRAPRGVTTRTASRHRLCTARPATLAIARSAPAASSTSCLASS